MGWPVNQVCLLGLGCGSLPVITTLGFLTKEDSQGGLWSQGGTLAAHSTLPVSPKTQILQSQWSSKKYVQQEDAPLVMVCLRLLCAIF